MSSDDQVPVKKIDDLKPVVWTPEDASRFLTSAIQEAQRPLADALKDRPITSRALTIIIAVLCLAALIIGLILSSQIEKADREVVRVNKEAKEIASERDAARVEKERLQITTTAMEERLTDVREQRSSLQSQLQEQIEAIRGGDEELRRSKADLQRFRRQNELLRSQISGLEMEKVALARQLDAVKAMAIDEADETGDAAVPTPDDGAAAPQPEEETAAPAVSAAGPEHPEPTESKIDESAEVVFIDAPPMAPAEEPHDTETPEPPAAVEEPAIAAPAEPTLPEATQPQIDGETPEEPAAAMEPELVVVPAPTAEPEAITEPEAVAEPEPVAEPASIAEPEAAAEPAPEATQEPESMMEALQSEPDLDGEAAPSEKQSETEPVSEFSSAVVEHHGLDADDTAAPEEDAAKTEEPTADAGEPEVNNAETTIW